jgi:hypothetical protein
MNLLVQINTELEAALNTIAAREQRDVQDVIRGALERFALDNAKPLPFGLALPKALRICRCGWMSFCFKMVCVHEFTECNPRRFKRHTGTGQQKRRTPRSG